MALTDEVLLSVVQSHHIPTPLSAVVCVEARDGSVDKLPLEIWDVDELVEDVEGDLVDAFEDLCAG